MPLTATRSSIEQTFLPVKAQVDTQLSLPLFPESVIHHKVLLDRIVIRSKKDLDPRPYGVSPAYRVLSPQLLLKRFDQVRDCLEHTLGLTPAQREVALRLLRLHAYYGYVYPKESGVTLEPGCSKATFWRTLRLLKSLGVVRVVNRYVIRPHAQISNLYLLHNLLVVIARYLAEHGVAFAERWLKPYLQAPGQAFWRVWVPSLRSRAGP